MQYKQNIPKQTRRKMGRGGTLIDTSSPLFIVLICHLSHVTWMTFWTCFHFRRASSRPFSFPTWHYGSDLCMWWWFYYGAVGMLWTGETPEAKAVEENMVTYFNTLQGLLLLSHGSMVGAGPTLSSAIHASIKQVVDCSFKLMMETVSSYGNFSFCFTQTNALNAPVP